MDCQPDNGAILEDEQYIRLIKKSHRDFLLSLPNVTGVGIGYKSTNGILTTWQSICVYVVKKKPLEDLKKSECIPSQLDGIPTDVIEVGELQALGYTAMERPALGGASLGDLNLGSGTLGTRFIDNTDGTGVILSNNHVISLADDVVRNAAVEGSLIIQPGLTDGGDASHKIARLKRWIKFEMPPNWNQVDAAIAEIIGPLMASARIHDIGRYNGWRSVTAGDLFVVPVQKVGRTTGRTYGLIGSIAYDVPYDYGYGYVYLEDQILILSIGFADHGDSGSMVLDMQNRLLGILWGAYVTIIGVGVAAVVSPISAVLSQLNISVCPRC